MPSSTPLRGRPYPLEGDSPDVASDIHNLALNLDTSPVTTQGVLASRPAAAAAGNQYMVQGDGNGANNGILWWDTGSGWVAINQGFAPLASPVFTGTPEAPTPTAGDSSTKLATTAFVTAAIPLVWGPFTVNVVGLAQGNSADTPSPLVVAGYTFHDPLVVGGWEGGELSGLLWSANFTSPNSFTLVFSNPTSTTYGATTFTGYILDNPTGNQATLSTVLLP